MFGEGASFNFNAVGCGLHKNSAVTLQVSSKMSNKFRNTGSLMIMILF